MGVFFILAATILWGLSPLYYSLLNSVPAMEVVAHRILWSLPCLAIYAVMTGRGPRFIEAGRSPRILLTVAVASAFISVNWVAFVYAIQIGQTAQASFGYYIYPLAAIILGALVFRERISPLQWLAAVIAVIGVVWIAMERDAAPWLALLVATTFAIYSIIRKTALVGPLIGVLWELTLVTPFLLLYLVYVGGGAFFYDWETAMLLIGGSLFTGLPLVFFVEASKLLRFSTMGVLFFVNPTLQFISAVLLGEAITLPVLGAFGVIWMAVALYCYALIRQDRRARAASRAASEVSATS